MSVLTKIVKEREQYTRTHRGAARRAKRTRAMFDVMLIASFAAVAYFCHDHLAAFIEGLF